MQKRNANLTVGIVIIISLAILIFGVRYLNETRFSENTMDVIAAFTEVGTLTEGDPVKINGVKMGKVKTIRLKQPKVEVVMAINKEITITKDSRVVIQNIGLMGERMIGIMLGTGDPVEPGEVLTGDFDSGIAEAMGMMGQVLTQVQEAVEELRGIVHQTVGDKAFLKQFKTITARLDRTTATLNRLVAQNEQVLQGSIHDLSSVSSDVKEFLDNNKERLDKTVGNVEEITEQTKVLIARADHISKDVEELIDRMNSDRSSVGRILNDTAFVEDLKGTIVQADSLIRQIKRKGIKVGFW